jgi:hypothetical protein
LLSPVAPVLKLCGLGGAVKSVGEFGRGFVTGVAKGLAGTFEGIYNMVAHPLDTLGGMAAMAGVAVVGYTRPVPGISPEKRLQKFDDIFGTNLATVNDGIKQSLSETGDKFLHGTNVERGEVAGQAVEFVAELVVGTKGAGAAMKAVKAGSMGSKAAKVANVADKVTDITKTAGSKIRQWTLDKLPKGKKGIFGKKKKKVWKKHEDCISDHLGSKHPIVGKQITLKVEGIGTNGKPFKKKIRIDNLYKDKSGRYQLVDAKHSSVKDLQNVPKMELRNTFTKNQKIVYDAIGGKNGAKVTKITPVGKNANDMGINVKNIIIEPKVEIGVNTANGGIYYRDYP